jgi:hypothetical protein
MIKRMIGWGTVAASLALCGVAHAQLGPADFSYYFGYNEINPGFDFSGLTPFGSDLGVVGIAENRDLGGSNTAPNWPDASVVFMADVTTTFTAPHAGTYSFTLGSDDGAYAYIDSSLFLNDGGIHGIQYVTGSLFLTAGAHDVEIQYGNLFCCGAVLDFNAVPEPTTWAMMFVGFAGLGLAGYAGSRKHRTISAL